VCDVAQNARIQTGSREKVDENLQRIMRKRYQLASASARKFDVPGPLVIGGNIASFRRVAEAMVEQRAV
jgi:glutamate dehydrogenase (NADP+)